MPYKRGQLDEVELKIGKNTVIKYSEVVPENSSTTLSAFFIGSPVRQFQAPLTQDGIQLELRVLVLLCKPNLIVQRFQI